MASRNNQFLLFELKGAAELAQALRELGQDRLIKATLKRTLLKVAQPAAADAQRRAPRGKERGKPHMADKIAVSTTLSRRQKRSRGWSAGENDGNTAHVYMGAAPKGPAVLAEFGTQRRHHKNGKDVGSMPAEPFMRPAWEAHKDQMLADFMKELWNQVERSATRLAKRQAKAAGIT